MSGFFCHFFPLFLKNSGVLMSIGRQAFPRRENGFNKEVKGNSSEQTWQFYELQGKGPM